MHNSKKKIVIIGGGFGGLSAACYLAKDGHDVTLIEQHDVLGGRARVWQKDGFTFDMGPSWYLMPDVYEKFFAHFGKKPSDYYKLVRLDPSYRIYFAKNDIVEIPADANKTAELFESIEVGAGAKLKQYLAQAKYQYEVSMNEFIYKDFNSIFDFFNWRMLTEGRQLHVFEKLAHFTKRYFKSEKLRKILEYSMVFLGGAPTNTPALYSVITHAEMNEGVWYPMGGFGEMVKAMVKLGEELGVKFMLNSKASGFEFSGRDISAVKIEGGTNLPAEVVVANADYHFVDQNLLPKDKQGYSISWWKNRTVAPSALIFYVGLNKKIKDLRHHTLFVDENWTSHFNTIFENPSWPDKPSFYVCTPSVTDPSVAPQGKENLFFLVPMASGIEYDADQANRIKKQIYERFENLVGEKIIDDIIVEREFSIKDFSKDYNALAGTGLGLAHTIMQTAIFRPKMRSKKVPNLYYVGHHTQPGVGVPMVVISGQIVSEKISNEQV